MAERAATYSQIISPEEYNRIISREHIYISASDRVIRKFVETHAPKDRVAEVVEIGCGPARILPIMAEIPNIHLVGVDHDPDFLGYASRVIAAGHINASVARGDIATWRHHKPVDIFYSQGVHHHIGKKHDLSAYLSNVASQLAKHGVYVVSDEFLPNYTDEAERKRKAVVWYAHVIANAKRLGHEFLAQEESKTLLDDLYEGDPAGMDVKTEAQIALALNTCEEIDELARDGRLEEAARAAQTFLDALAGIRNDRTHGDQTVDLSRGDYKICDRVFREEMDQNGFEVVERRTVGPVDAIGGMAVYVVRRSC